MLRTTIKLISTLRKPRFKTTHSRSRRRGEGGSRALSVESLEDRRMLSAVGEFEKIGGNWTASATHDLRANGTFVADHKDRSGTDLIAFVFGKRVSVGSATAEAGTYFSGRSTAMVGGTTATPTVLGNGLVYSYSLGVTPGDQADSRNQAGLDGYANYEFESGGISGNLVFHGHLAISAGIERIIIGSDGYANSESAVLSQILGFGTLYATRELGDVAWTWGQDLPGEDQDFTGTSVGAISRHITFTISISDGALMDFLSIFNSTAITDITADPIVVAREFTSGAAAAWGYVTLEGQDVPDGDFDYDGVVDGDDFKLWQEGSLQADFDLDGDVTMTTLPFGSRTRTSWSSPPNWMSSTRTIR